MFLLVIYDVGINKKRNQIAKFLGGYGTRVQKSVFELDVDFGGHKEVCFGLEKMMEKWEKIEKRMLEKALAKAEKNGEELDTAKFGGNDSVRIYTLNEKSLQSVKILGVGKLERMPPFIILD